MDRPFARLESSARASIFFVREKTSRTFTSEEISTRCSSRHNAFTAFSSATGAPVNFESACRRERPKSMKTT